MRCLLLTLFLASAYASYQHQVHETTNWKKGYVYTMENSGRLAWTDPHYCNTYKGYLFKGLVKVQPESNTELYVTVSHIMTAPYTLHMADGIGGYINKDSLHYQRLDIHEFTFCIVLHHGKVVYLRVPDNLSPKAKLFCLAIASNLQYPQGTHYGGDHDKFTATMPQLFGNCTLNYVKTDVTNAFERDCAMFYPIPPSYVGGNLTKIESKTQRVNCKGSGTGADPHANTFTSYISKFFENWNERTLQSSSTANVLEVYDKHYKKIEIIHRSKLQMIGLTIAKHPCPYIHNAVHLKPLEYTSLVAGNFYQIANALYITGASGIPKHDHYDNPYVHKEKTTYVVHEPKSIEYNGKLVPNPPKEKPVEKPKEKNPYVLHEPKSTEYHGKPVPNPPKEKPVEKPKEKNPYVQPEHYNPPKIYGHHVVSSSLSNPEYKPDPTSKTELKHEIRKDHTKPATSSYTSKYYY